MAKAVIAYDKDLPEIPDRRAWERPSAHLVKDPTAPTGWGVREGRRETNMLLVPKIRTMVDSWREEGYPGASDVALRLFQFWFDEEHEVPGFPVPFRYHFCQREAIETLVWLVEVARVPDTKLLIERYATSFRKDLLTNSVEFQTSVEGQRQIRRYLPELDAIGIQDLPPEYLRRFSFKMATGSGKTWVMGMVIVYSHFHRKWIADSPLSKNILIVAPNIIVYQRLERDFSANGIFYDIPLIPTEWRAHFSQQVILRGEGTEPAPSGNLFVTNIQQLYESREQEWTPQNAVEALLGKRPTHDAVTNQRSILERVKSLSNLVVINDEAHHVHDEDLAWSQSLLAVHRALPKGLGLWLDFSATPKDQNGMYFPWTVCDYPLAQAVEDRIVKAPLIVTRQDDPKQPKHEPEGITKENITEKYGYWLRAAIERWREHWDVYQKLGTRPVLFIMTEKNVYADAIGKYLWKTKEFGFNEPEVLVIHTDSKGEITKKYVEEARQVARDIDNVESRIKAIVSVMMLREGWDVRNVTVVLGLRPFTAKAEILPEQVIGRGLRLMIRISPDRTQTLEVLGTRKLLDVLREQLEAEGVGVAIAKADPPSPVIISPVKERLVYDIAIPITKPTLVHDVRKLTEINVAALEPIYDQGDLAGTYRQELKIEFAQPRVQVGEVAISFGDLPLARELLASITAKVVDRGKLPNRFADLYPIVRDYVVERCFGDVIDPETETIRSHLWRVELQEGIAKYLARKLGELTLEHRTIEFERADFKLSYTRPFKWQRNLPPLHAKKTVFNYVATYNDFERQFAMFLDERARDVLRFASLGTTDQGESGTQFRVDYIKPSGAIGFYHPDWVVVQDSASSEVNWIIETKGRVWEGTEAKDEAVRDWCRRVTTSAGKKWLYLRVNQREFDGAKISSLEELVRGGAGELMLPPSSD